MILNVEPNCQVSTTLINPFPIYVKRSENDSEIENLSKVSQNFPRIEHQQVLT
jgi:hypothetical protein